MLKIIFYLLSFIVISFIFSLKPFSFWYMVFLLSLVFSSIFTVAFILPLSEFSSKWNKIKILQRVSNELYVLSINLLAGSFFYLGSTSLKNILEGLILVVLSTFLLALSGRNIYNEFNEQERKLKYFKDLGLTSLAASILSFISFVLNRQLLESDNIISMIVVFLLSLFFLNIKKIEKINL